MKALLTLVLATLLLSHNTYAQQAGQDSTGLPGDNFSLQAALEAFEKADSPEAFERAINTADNYVNNLDLNDDGETDYVRVTDLVDGDVHVFVLQVPVSEKESQDIAVIELEKTGEGEAVIQIVGDEDIYGEEVIFEPEGTVDHRDSRRGAGPAVDPYGPDIYVVVNVWTWPLVRFVYAPVYKPWVSPWRWRHYPAWWRPWRPVRWHVWHPHHHFHRKYVVANTRRVVRAPKIYRPVRTTSVIVQKRHGTAIGNYRVKRSKTTVTGPRGNKATVNKTTVKGPKGKASRTTVKGSKGKVKATKTVRKRKN